MTAIDVILETVRWREGKIRILDQRKLPSEETYPELTSVSEVISAIRTLAVRGAPAIGVAGALGLALEANRLRDQPAAIFRRRLGEAAEALIGARPTAVNLRWACRRTLQVVEQAAGAAAEAAGTEALASACLREGLAILEEDLALSRAMAHYGAQMLPLRARVISHCNTGGLATAGGGTALGVVFEAVRQGKEIFVHVDETRPLLQGARLTAWELQRLGIPCAVHCDSAAAWLMSLGRRNVPSALPIDAVLVGADRVAANGDTANKVGTLGLALAAREYGVPFYVVAPRSSFDLSLATGEEIPIEERAALEVLEFAGARSAPAGAEAYNPAFDVTPSELISAWVTERGVEEPPFLG